MIPVSYLFEDEEYLMFEGLLSKMKSMFKGRKIEDLMDKPSVQEFVAISESMMNKKKVSFQDKQKILKLLKDKDVKLYLEEVDSNAKRSGTAIGGLGGSYIGAWAGVLTAAGLGATAGGAIAVGLLGAASLGLLGAAVMRKMSGIGSRWQRESNVRKQTSGMPVHQVQTTT